MIMCRTKKLYYVALNKAKVFHDGGWSNYIATPYLGRARYYAKKLKLRNRQIDVRAWGKGKYVLQGSWL
jgi:hypothetical protein